MKTLLVVTFVDFWAGGSGHRTRIATLLGFLQSRVRITVYFAGMVSQDERTMIRAQFPHLLLECSGQSTYGEYTSAFANFIRDKQFDFALVEYIELSGVLEYLPPDTITLLDTHDLVAHRISTFRQSGIRYEGIDLTPGEELDIFRCYDYVILIQQTELESVAREIDRCRLLLTPHPVTAERSGLREHVRHIGFVASPYAPNVEALQWFLRNVWQPIKEQAELTLHIYGNIRGSFPDWQDATIRWHGFVADVGEAYRTCDILINPVRCGAGLKIKNVEALAHGLPLVTTSHGAAGMEDGNNSCFLTADDAQGFQAAIHRLIVDLPLRERLSLNAWSYAETHFSTERCYSALTNILT